MDSDSDLLLFLWALPGALLGFLASTIVLIAWPPDTILLRLSVVAGGAVAGAATLVVGALVAVYVSVERDRARAAKGAGR